VIVLSYQVDIKNPSFRVPSLDAIASSNSLTSEDSGELGGLAEADGDYDNAAAEREGSGGGKEGDEDAGSPIESFSTA
jgi:hypothetical protein